MLKLKYLFDNRDLAEMILKNWEYDLDSIKLFDFYRISANAVYPFRYNEKVRFLRFSPTTEKDRNNLVAELEFIDYLKTKDYPALCTVASKHNRKIEEVTTPWGNYFAVVFEHVSGGSLEEIEYTEEVCRKHGTCLGRLHKLSLEYQPKNNPRWSYEDALTWIEKELIKFPDEILAKQEIDIIRRALENLPKNNQNFGLIHYDFELDNVFYDQDTDMLSVIDFDDAMYHWYAMDIQQALDSIEGEIDSEEYPIMKENFIEGYRKEFNVSDEMLSHMPIFKRFSNLYVYLRILSSSEEVWENEPKWLNELRGKFSMVMKQRSVSFGEPI